MSDESSEWELKELPWDVWSNMLRDFKCPTCETKVERKKFSETEAKFACDNCKTYLEPPKRRKGERKDPDLRTKEAAAERSGGSLYPPLPIYYFCEGCQETKLKRIELRNHYEVEAELPLTLPDGKEGFTYSLITQRLILPYEEAPTFPFTCGCGQRYYLDLKLIKRDKIKHPLFAIQLGFHTECMRCRYAFDKGVGKDYFQFRCDKNLDCSHIQQLKETDPERIWIVEESP